jgi:hypothetical protein
MVSLRWVRSCLAASPEPSVAPRHVQPCIRQILAPVFRDSQYPRLAGLSKTLGHSNDRSAHPEDRWGPVPCRLCRSGSDKPHPWFCGNQCVFVEHSGFRGNNGSIVQGVREPSSRNSICRQRSWVYSRPKFEDTSRMRYKPDPRLVVLVARVIVLSRARRAELTWVGPAAAEYKSKWRGSPDVCCRMGSAAGLKGYRSFFI